MIECAAVAPCGTKLGLSFGPVFYLQSPFEFASQRNKERGAAWKLANHADVGPAPLTCSLREKENYVALFA